MLIGSNEGEGSDDVNMYASGAREPMHMSENDSDSGEDGAREPMHVSENGSDSGEDGARESMLMSENDSDGSGEEYSDASSSEQVEEPATPEWNMERIPESSFEPLYNGSTVTVCGAYLCIMKYAITAKLSYKAIQGLLNLLQVICPSSNKLPKSLHKLKMFFRKYTAPCTSSKVCSKCSTPCQGPSKQTNCEKCSSATELGNFIHIHIAKSLETIVSSKSELTGSWIIPNIAIMTGFCNVHVNAWLFCISVNVF